LDCARLSSLFVGGGDGPLLLLACGAGPSSQLVGAGGGPSSKMVGGGGQCSPFVGWGVCHVGAGVGPSSLLVGGGGLCSPLVWGHGGPCSPLVWGRGGPCSLFVGGQWVLIVGHCCHLWALVCGVVLVLGHCHLAATSPTATWQLGSRRHCLALMWPVVQLVTWRSSCDGGGQPMWWVVGIMGGGVEEAKVAMRWGCVGVVDDGGG